MRNPWAGEEEGSSNANTSGSTNKMEEPWAGLSERTLVAMVEQLFSHLLKVLNICAHVLDDTPPGPAVKVTIQSLWWLVWSAHNLLLQFKKWMTVKFWLSSLFVLVPYNLGHPPLPEQHPLPQSYPEKRQGEGRCWAQCCPYEPKERQWGQHRCVQNWPCFSTGMYSVCVYHLSEDI